METGVEGENLASSSADPGDCSGVEHLATRRLEVLARLNCGTTEEVALSSCFRLLFDGCRDIEDCMVVELFRILDTKSGCGWACLFVFVAFKFWRIRFQPFSSDLALPRVFFIFCWISDSCFLSWDFSVFLWVSEIFLVVVLRCWSLLTWDRLVFLLVRFLSFILDFVSTIFELNFLFGLMLIPLIDAVGAGAFFLGDVADVLSRCCAEFTFLEIIDISSLLHTDFPVALWK